MRITFSISWCCLVLSVLISIVLGESGPKIERTSKGNDPAKQIIYFDDSSTVLILRSHKLSVSHDDGNSWSDVKETKDESVIHFEIDPNFKDRAFVFTANEKQYVTNDQGKSWTTFKLLGDDDKPLSIDSIPKVHFNSKKREYALIEVYDCPPNEGFNSKCKKIHFYTDNGFKTNPMKLKSELNHCRFAKSSSNFEGGNDETVYCTVNKLNSFGHVVESYLSFSNDFFKTSEDIDHGLVKSAFIIDIKFEQTFMVIIVQNDKFNKKSVVSLLVSKDGKNFREADLKVNVSYGIMAYLESSPSSLFLSVMDFSSSMVSLSTVYASDSSGLKFTKILSSIEGGAIEKVQTIDGVWLANVAEDKDGKKSDKNLLDLFLGGSSKLISSKITYNNGKDWSPLKIIDDDSCKVEDGCSLHLISPVERDGRGKFVTGPTPAILVGIGSKGKHLSRDINDMNTWVSRDGGLTWKFSLEEPCLFSFGDLGNVILASPIHERDSKTFDTKKLIYSLDQGKSWTTEELGESVFPEILSTTVDGTSTKFILSAIYDETPDDNSDLKFSEAIYTIDFGEVYGGAKCQKKDFEEIYARVSEDQKPICIDGHKEKFIRRKQDAKCFVNSLFEDIKVYDDPCPCTDADFECADGFKLNTGTNTCDLVDARVSELCQSKKSKVLKLPAKVHIEGNTCSFGKKKPSEFVDTVDIKCADYLKQDTTKAIKSSSHKFDGELAEYIYIEDNASAGENVIVKSKNDKVFISNDGGISFSQLNVESIVGVFAYKSQVILITESTTFYISFDGGNSFSKMTAPSTPSRESKVFSPHKTDPNMFIWLGSGDCDNNMGFNCPSIAYVTKDGGQTFQPLKKDVLTCDFAGPVFDPQTEENKNLIYCLAKEKSNPKLEILSSNDFFKSSKVLFESAVGYAFTGKFCVVALIGEKEQSLKAKVTVDGVTFADADFPSDLHVDYQQAYTILDSASEAIFMHVTTNPKEGHEYGSILKSNSNGTSYVLSLDYVNRNRVGYVDYDRIEGIEGIIVVNRVQNHNSNDPKILRTQISYNDGAEWAYINPPIVNSKGKKYSCSGQPLEKCSLNVRGYTERPDYRDTFSSASATGLMFGVGSVGSSLEGDEKSSTFMTTDGGITWKEVVEGVYMWEFGDRGTILVLVNAKEPTNNVLFSLDDGHSWNKYEFSKTPVEVLDLATVPSDTSRKFLVFGKDQNEPSITVSFSLDFTQVHNRQCQIDLDNPDNDDYEFWSPKHPLLPDNCLFGHEAKYLRRAKGHYDCFIGSAPSKEGFKVIRNCSCTRSDFECDYNYFRDSDGTCKLVKGLSPSNRKNEECKKPNAFEYFEPTGYRKVPLSTCVGGKNFDTWNARPCPGKEKEFNKHYGKEVKGYKLFFLIAIPLFVFIFATWFVYDRGIRRNGGFKRFGQIRLDTEDDDFQPIEDNEVDKAVNKIVRGGIFVAAVGIAGFKTLQKFDRVILNKIVSTVFRRHPGERRYVQVPSFDEEEELFGDFRDDHEDGINDDQVNFDSQEPETAGDDYPNNLEQGNTDSRLFDIDDQSDEESSRPEA